MRWNWHLPDHLDLRSSDERCCVAEAQLPDGFCVAMAALDHVESDVCDGVAIGLVREQS